MVSPEAEGEGVTAGEATHLPTASKQPGERESVAGFGTRVAGVARRAAQPWRGRLQTAACREQRGGETW